MSVAAATLKGGEVSKRVRDAIKAAAAPASTDITDATTTGRAVLTAASVAAARTAIGAAPVTAPASATATGVKDSWAYDATHLYVCIATNVWVRATLATW